jgi:hypothetical protein
MSLECPLMTFCGCTVADLQRDVLAGLRAKMNLQAAQENSDAAKKSKFPAGLVPKLDWMFPKVDWMFPKVDWMSPKVDWMFPKVDWMFPKLDWTFPKFDWMFPKLDWMSPKLDWMFPKLDWTFPKFDCTFLKFDWTFPKLDWMFPKLDWMFTQEKCCTPRSPCVGNSWRRTLSGTSKTPRNQKSMKSEDDRFHTQAEMGFKLKRVNPQSSVRPYPGARPIKTRCRPSETSSKRARPIKKRPGFVNPQSIHRLHPRERSLTRERPVTREKLNSVDAMGTRSMNLQVSCLSPERLPPGQWIQMRVVFPQSVFCPHIRERPIGGERD